MQRANAENSAIQPLRHLLILMRNPAPAECPVAVHVAARLVDLALICLLLHEVQRVTGEAREVRGCKDKRDISGHL